jgi:hypothetical protein
VKILSPNSNCPTPVHSGPPYFVAYALVLVLCVCGSACQVRVPASTSGTVTTSATTSVADFPSATALDDSSPQDSVTPATTVAQDPEIQTAPAEEQPPPRRGNDQAILITFDDLKLEMEKDTVYDPAMLTERVKELDGRRVRIRGFIFPSVFQMTGITSFPLIKNLECKFGPGGQAHHIVLVEMKPGLSTDFTVRPIAVEGVLAVKPWTGPDNNTWALYHMVGEAVE